MAASVGKSSRRTTTIHVRRYLGDVALRPPMLCVEVKVMNNAMNSVGCRVCQGMTGCVAAPDTMSRLCMNDAGISVPEILGEVGNTPQPCTAHQHHISCKPEVYSERPASRGLCNPILPLGLVTAGMRTDTT